LSKKEPPGSSASGNPKPFLPQKFKEGPSSDASFQYLWPQMTSKKYSSQFHQYLKEVETKYLQKAKEKALLLEKEAYEKGFAEGEKNGMELGKKKIENILTHLDHLVAEMESRRTELCRKYEKEMIHLVLGIAKSILHREVGIREEVIARTLQEAMKLVTDRKGVQVHLNPLDSQFLLSQREKISFPSKEIKSIQMVEDPSISRGGCFLETTYGEIDATLEGQIRQVASLIFQNLEKAPLPTS